MNTCPVCGYDKLNTPAYVNITQFSQTELDDLMPPYEDTLGTPSYEVCPNCKFEFGNDDNPGTVPQGKSFSKYRAEWQKPNSNDS